jgi:long-chain fatty acid transport protein
MQKLLKILAILCFGMVLSSSAFATNGDNLIAIGPIARAMGGVGIAAPQDAISAVFANPAAMCFGPYCPSSEFNFAGTLFMPHVDASVTEGGKTFHADSDEKVYAIPAIGLSYPLTSGAPFWRLGLAAYGVTGLGVDYRDTALDKPHYFDLGPFGTQPLIAGEYTQLSIMKFAPAIAVQPLEKLSLGLALHIDYADLDLRSGSSSSFGVGVQVGAIYKLMDDLSLGFNYVSPQNIDHDEVSDFDGDGQPDTLKLQSPQQVGLGLAYKLLDNKLLLETDVKWINWADANGYETFDWDDQWVFAFGVQYAPIPRLNLRLGYNYANNPVNEHNGFVGNTLTSVQGKYLPTYYYETFRIIGFPAVVEQHIPCGIGFDLTSKFALNLGYTHGFEKTIKETGTNFLGQPTMLKSSLSEDSIDFGLTWRF